MKRLYRILFGLFFLSGFCGLLYQIVWLRKAFSAFGVITPVLSVLLSVFMLGLSLGSWFGGKVIDRLSSRINPIIFYGIIEALIGVGAFAVPIFFKMGENYLLTFGAANSTAYLFLSAIIITLSILPWCFFMGTTFPFMMAFVKRVDANNTTSFSFLYLANVVGAMSGVFLTAIVFIELLGFSKTLWIAALSNFTIAITSFILAGIYGSNVLSYENVISQQPDIGNGKESAESYKVSGESRLLICTVLFLTGFTSMAMEVVWTRAFIPILKTAVYSFAALLFLYLLATWIGSYYYRKHSARGKLASLETLLGYLSISAVLSILVNDPRIPGYQAGIFLSILPFCFILGYLTPSLIDKYSQGVPEKAGSAYAINVVGCILGPLFAGYLLLPYIGIKWGLVFLIIPLIIVFSYSLKLLSEFKKRNYVLLAVSIILVIVGAVASVSYEERTLYKNGEIRRDHTATVISEGQGMGKRLLVNGIGMTGLTTITKIMAHLPLATVDNPQSALVICFGMGTTFRSLMRWDIKVKAVELVPSIKDAYGFYFADAADLLNNPKGEVIIDDGRRFLKRTDDKFDVITLDPPPPVEAAGSGLLYSKEFYDLIKMRLTDKGILQQWFPGGEDKIFQAVLRAVVDSFPYVRVIRSIKGRGYHITAALHPIAIPTVDQMRTRLPLAAQNDLLEWHPGMNINYMLNFILSRELDINQLLNSDTSIVITDDKPFNEYFFLRRYLFNKINHRGQDTSSGGLSGPAHDAVDLAIVCLAINDASTHPELSTNLKQHLARYNGTTTFTISCNKVGQRLIDHNGVPGIQIVLLPGSRFKCAYKGKLSYSVEFYEGEFGIADREIYVKEKTRMSIDSEPYIFLHGKWMPSK